MIGLVLVLSHRSADATYERNVQARRVSDMGSDATVHEAASARRQGLALAERPPRVLVSDRDTIFGGDETATEPA